MAARFKTNKQTYVCYVDFSKAFDTVVRNQLLEKFKNNGLSTKFHNILSVNLRINYLRICICDFVSDRINQNRGLLQGDPLSPLLFILFTADLALILSIFGSCYFYADDLAIVTNSTQQMTEALKRLKIYCRKNNLTVNISKTKMMKIRKGSHTGRKDIVLYKGQPLEYVNSFEYLGVTKSAFMKDKIHNSKLHRKGITSVNILAAKVNFQ